MSQDLRRSVHAAASAIEAIAREVGTPDEWVNPSRWQRLANRLAQLAATLREAAVVDEHMALVSAPTEPPWTPEPPGLAPVALSDRQDPPRPYCPVCHQPLVLARVMPPVGSDDEELADLSAYFTRASTPGTCYVWRCANGPHRDQQR
jgi:hypothetical protein